MKMKISRLFIITTMIIFAATSNVTAQIKLTLNPKVGTSYEMNAEVKSTINTLIGNSKIPIDVTTTQTYMMTVIGKTSEGTKLNFIYKRFTVGISGMMMNLSFDSESKTEPTTEIDKTLSAIINPIIDKTFSIVIDTDGKIVSLTGMDAVIKSMESSSAANPALAPVTGMIKQLFSDETMKQTFFQYFSYCNSNVIKTGDTWQKDNTVNISGIKGKIKSNYTLKSVTGTTAKIEANSNIDFDMKSQGIGTATGTQIELIEVNTETGVPIMQNIEQNITHSSNNTNIEIVNKGVTRIKIKDR
ncbi:MAG: DUF6263 family protein [Dysgonamonadaceae bacterium]|jgi:hypothetical protein|nr:DUF6263 family protein [Dysgonamonadaceae bacterium]